MPKPSPIFFTQAGFDKLEQEFQDLKAKRPGYVIELTKASELGDRSENAAYRVNKQRVRRTDSRLRYLEKLIDRARVVQATQSEYVEIGSTVRLSRGVKEFTFQIVGGNESDPSKGFISYQSPLGQALLRKRVGESAAITVDQNTFTYEILSISAEQ